MHGLIMSDLAHILKEAFLGKLPVSEEIKLDQAVKGKRTNQ